MQITFDANKKKLDTNPVFGLLVQGENLAESIQITGPKMVGALDLSQLRVAVRMTSAEYETTVEKTLEQTTDGDTITLIWEVDKQFTGSPGKVDVMLVGYGGNEEVIKITSSGMVVQEDRTFDTAPPESTWEQILQQMQDFATQAYESKTAAANSAAEAAASQKVAEEKAEQATNAASEAVKAAETAATDAAAQAAAKTEQQIRQYADDRYARALQGTADPAASITIYPDAGSNVVVTAHGFTVQEGSGDASPVNVRPIVNGGDLSSVFPESDAEYCTVLENHGVNILPKNSSSSSTQTGVTFTPNEDGTFQVKGTATADADYYIFGNYVTENVKFILAPGEYFLSGNKDTSGVVIYLLSRVKGEVTNVAVASTTAGIKFSVQKYTPITACLFRAVKGKTIDGTCKPMLNIGQAALPYVPFSGCNRSVIKLTAPLCKGDKLITKVKSGCDKKLVLDGTESFIVDSASTFADVIRFSIQLSDANKASPVVFSERFTPSTVFTLNSEYIGITDIGKLIGAVYKNRLSSQDAEGIKAYFAANPLPVWYCSTAYTDSADIPVALEVHAYNRIEYTGNEVFYSASVVGEMGYYFFQQLDNANTGGTNQSDAVCSHLTNRKEIFDSELAKTKANVFCVGVSSTPRFIMSHEVLGTSPSSDVRACKEAVAAYLKNQYAQGTPMVLVYKMKTPITYAHEPVDFIANPGEDGAWVITGEANGKVSAVFNKNLTHTIAELQAALLAVSAKLSL